MNLRILLVFFSYEIFYPIRDIYPTNAHNVKAVSAKVSVVADEVASAVDEVASVADEVASVADEVVSVADEVVSTTNVQAPAA